MRKWWSPLSSSSIQQLLIEGARLLSTSMESQTQTKVKVYAHYDHLDACKFSRWTARESFQFMSNRSWEKVVDFYGDVVAAGDPIPFITSLFPAQRRELLPEIQSSVRDDDELKEVSDVSESMRLSKKEKGGSSVERCIGRFVDEKKAQQLKSRGLPIEGIAVVAGRTDKGVTALQQVCSFYTWRKDVKPQDIIDAFNEAERGNLRIVSVAEVSRVFHPNFCAKWRRYLYIFPLNDGEVEEEQKITGECEVEVERKSCEENYGSRQYKYAEGINDEIFEDNPDYDEDVIEGKRKPTRFTISKVNQLLCQLEGKLLSYKMFARDTKASRNIGPPTECFMFHARAAEARIPSSVLDGEVTKAMCVELVANRFLRKMVRVLVATAVREAAAGAEEDALLKLMGATCRRATAPPAPPEGLCLVDVGYLDFHPRICFIS